MLQTLSMKSFVYNKINITITINLIVQQYLKYFIKILRICKARNPTYINRNPGYQSNFVNSSHPPFKNKNRFTLLMISKNNKSLEMTPPPHTHTHPPQHSAKPLP